MFFLRITMAITIFLIYGSVEKVFQSGIYVTIALSLYLMRYVSLWKSLLLLATHLVSYYYQLRAVVFLSFFFLNALFLFGSYYRNDDDTFVQLKPYEKEIRQLLMKYNTEALTRVDSLLLKYKGREKQLLKKIQDKYEPGSSDPSNNMKHEEIYASNDDTVNLVTSGGKGSSSSGKHTFEIRNPLSDQIMKQQQRSQSIRASGRSGATNEDKVVDDHMITYGKIYEDEDEFETSNPMVEGADSPAVSDSTGGERSPLASVLRYRGGPSDSIGEEENPLLARSNQLRSNITTPLASRTSLLSSSSSTIRKPKFDQSLIEQAKQEAREKALRLIDEKYGRSQQ